MGGGLMQLVAYGAQDIYLTGNPQITFFKVVYRRHTNFAVESIEQTFNGQADFGKRVTATIARNGDLIQQMYLEVVLPLVTPAYDTNEASPSNVALWTYGVGNALVKQVEIEIGGQLIDRQYGDWMNIWSELTISAGKREVYDMVIFLIINIIIILLLGLLIIKLEVFMQILIIVYIILIILMDKVLVYMSLCNFGLIVILDLLYLLLPFNIMKLRLILNSVHSLI